MEDKEKADIPEEIIADHLVLDITDIDAQRFFNAYCNMKPYIEGIPIFGGKQEVHFRTKTMAETEFIEKYIKNATSEDTLVTEHNMIESTCLLATHLYGIDKKDGTGVDVFDPNNEGLARRIDIVKGMPGQIFSLYYEAMVAFNQKVLKLQKRALNQNF